MEESYPYRLNFDLIREMANDAFPEMPNDSIGFKIDKPFPFVTDVTVVKRPHRRPASESLEAAIGPLAPNELATPYATRTRTYRHIFWRNKVIEDKVLLRLYRLIQSQEEEYTTNIELEQEIDLLRPAPVDTWAEALLAAYAAANTVDSE